ncbi:phenylalanine--tRNA ligase subunit beta [Rhodobacteraceae bacterium NNCM2]|nr:phenylalanine--tRNA ligase subunit beta [Coraliihabitans acroporae]
MKFTLNWLKEHLETEASLDEITEALTDLGLELESVEDPAEKLGAFTICRVIEAMQHPNADRLRLCRVETWPNGPDKPSEEVQVVCGAPNARTGLVGVFAPVGTHVPGTGVDLKPGVIRGVESNGMLCSEREMMISEDHDGIIDLPEDAPMGVRYIDWAKMNDPVIEIAITPNRPDALGVAGVARDLAARGLGTVITKPVEPVAGSYPSPVTVTIDADVAEKACPVFCGRVIRGVKNGPSPAWLQQRLRAIGLRPISALVDITNFFTYDRNRPLHVFDVAKVKGGALRVHWAEPGAKLVALDDKEYTFEEGMMAISDAEGPESIAGIMGGLATGCTEETVDVFVESAYWDPVTVAATGRRLKINSDARYRFERGVDPEFTPAGVDLATHMIIELCGGEPSKMVIAGAVPDTARSYPLNPVRVESLVGMSIPRDEQVRILTALGFTVSGTGEVLSVAVPPWRPDVHGEADLVEEIARVASLTKLQSKPMPRPSTGVAAPTLTRMQKREQAARRQLAALGLNECVTYSFVSAAEAEMFGGGDPLLKLENPISSEMSDMRPSLLPGLLAAAARNQARGFADLGLFEVGPVFEGAEPGEQALQATVLRVGASAPKHWSGGARPSDLYDAKADAEAALASAGVATDKLMMTRDAPAWFHPGRSGALKLGPKNTLAVFGELHPKVLAAMDIKGPAVAATVYLENAPFPKAKSRTRPALNISDYQAVDRDFAFVVEAKVEAESILRAARAADKKLIEGARVFDVFDGAKAAEQLGEGMKSVAITLRLQPTTGTLTDAEIEALSAKVVGAVEKATGGKLRG